MRAFVVGAGLSGAVTARLLAEHGFEVAVHEVKDYVGGACYDCIRHGKRVHRFGPHIFHTNEDRVWEFVNRFTAMDAYEHKVLSTTGYGLVPWPINLETLEKILGYGDPIGRFEASKRMAAEEIPKPCNFEEAALLSVGKELYEALIYGYTKKQWAMDPKELSAELFGRIPVRTNRDSRFFTDKYQALPRGGYTAMIENMLSHERIRVSLMSHVSKAESYGGLFFSTASPDAMLNYAKGRLEYRSMRFDFERKAASDRLPAPVVNYPSEDTSFIRATDYGVMYGDCKDGTVVVREKPAWTGMPMYPVPTASNARLADEYISELRAIGVRPVGRLGTYRYLNMDAAIIGAMRAVDEAVAEVL